MPQQECFPPQQFIIPGCAAATFLLPVTYVRELQYWAEHLNLPEGPDFHPLVGSVIELREMVKEHVVFTNWDLLWDLGRAGLRATNQWPQTSSSSGVMLPLGDEPSKPDTSFTEATTQTVSPATTDAEPIRHTTSPVGTEGENWYLLVITASIGQLSLESAGNGLEGSSTAPQGGDTFQNPQMAAVLSTSTRVVGYGGATMEE